MDVKKWKAKKFQEAQDQLLDTNVAGMFKGIHRANELFEEHKITNPMPPQTLLDLGICMGAIQMMQECREPKDPEAVDPALTAAIYKGYLRAMFYQRLPHGETFGDVLYREDFKLHDAILGVVREEI